MRTNMASADMTPYEHYCEAERLLNEPRRRDDSQLIALAQVHATLATIGSSEVNSKVTMNLARSRNLEADE